MFCIRILDIHYSASFSFNAPWDFLAQLLASRAVRRGEHSDLSPAKKLKSFEVWDILKIARTNFEGNSDRLRFAPAERSGMAEFPPHPPSAAPSLRQNSRTNFSADFNKTFMTPALDLWIVG